MNRLPAALGASTASLSKSHPYLVAIVATACIALLRFLVIDPLIGNQVPVLLFLVAVIVAAWNGGLKPGLLAAALSAVTFVYFYFPPPGLEPGISSDWTRVLMFLVVSVVVSSCFDFIGALSAARTR